LHRHVNIAVDGGESGSISDPPRAGKNSWSKAVQFGIFDHCEQSSRPTGVTYQERFRLAQRAEAAGFYAYHVAEHHGSPLSLVPSPSVFLAALAQHTSTLRLGPLVYLLPLYDPYRLAEEICMLDHLSGGRLELGVGKGGNPIELGFFKLTPTCASDRFDEAFKAVMQGLTEGHISFEGQHYSMANSPLEDRTAQRPYPPIWYPTASASGSIKWAANQGFNTIVSGPPSICAEVIKVFRDNFVPGPHGNAPKIGVSRYVFIADTDKEAMRVGREAYAYHHANFSKLFRDAGIDLSKSPVMPPAELDEAVRKGWAVAGNPSTVREQLGNMFDQIGNNYFAFAPLIANLPLEWGLRTIDLFESEIMPSFASTTAAAATAKQAVA
jgi:alkanesulfonate monooxygenase SsuD/methylene tetrahydromethanopterin reductase-like flavin-dependent oxidoreductase (luciferase family)